MTMTRCDDCQEKFMPEAEGLLVEVKNHGIVVFCEKCANDFFSDFDKPFYKLDDKTIESYVYWNWF